MKSPLVMMLLACAIGGCAAPVATSQITAGIDRIDKPLTSLPGDARRGREIVLARDRGHCILCHTVTTPEVKFMGNVAPPLNGVGARLDEAQMRLRVVDIARINPHAAMPSFHRVDGLHNVAAEQRGKPILSAQEVEDVVAYLGTLRE